MSDYHNFYLKKRETNNFDISLLLSMKIINFFMFFYVICTIRLLALSATYWAETWVWLLACN